MPSGGTVPSTSRLDAELTESRLFEQMLSDQVARGVTVTPQVVRLLRDRLASQSRWAEAAAQAGLDRRDDVRVRLAQARRAVLAQAWVEAQVDQKRCAASGRAVALEHQAGSSRRCDEGLDRSAVSGPSVDEAETSNAR